MNILMGGIDFKSCNIGVSQYEAVFISSVHNNEDIDNIIGYFEKYAERLCRNFADGNN